MDRTTYDLVIVGSGPAGLTAAVYAGRYLLNTLVIGDINGGMISEAHKVCNFPTYDSITGMDLTEKMVGQVKSLGVKIISGHVKDVKQDKLFEVRTKDSMYTAKKVILATGSKKRKLDVKGETEFLGKGVSYCATCDASFFRNKVVAVVGGSNSALTAALLLSDYANKVYIVYRQERFFRAEPAWVRQVEKNEKIETIFSSNIREISGSDFVQKIILDSDKEIPVDGVFVEVGLIPNIELAKKMGLDLDDGHILVDKFQKTSIPGIFAAGDITDNPLKQAVTAAGEGAIAANSAYGEVIQDK